VSENQFKGRRESQSCRAAAGLFQIPFPKGRARGRGPVEREREREREGVLVSWRGKGGERRGAEQC